MSDFNAKIWTRKIQVRNRLIKMIDKLPEIDRETMLREYRKLYDAVVEKKKFCENCP